MERRVARRRQIRFGSVQRYLEGRESQKQSTVQLSDVDVDREDISSSSESLASSNATDSIKDPDYCPSDESTMQEQFQPLSELPLTSELQNSDELQKIAENKENLEERIDEMPSIPVKSSSVGTVEIGNQQIKKFSILLFLNHANEIEVQRILALPPRSKHRYNLLLDLRKKGNYLNSNAFAKPVRQGNSDSNYLPCTYCFGYYSTKNLWRHRKYCDSNPTKGEKQRNARSEGQNLLLRHLKQDSHFASAVFPRMRADQISLVAKKDVLICAFASRYLKIHREKHFILVASRKMRELARLLIEIRKVKPDVVTLFDALKPTNYDLLVAATQSASKYDKRTQSYQSPTFALNMGTTLKQCCDIALVHTLKQSEMLPSIQSGDVEAEMKTLVQLIEGNWKFDVSSQAATDLNMQKWNKVTLVPLAGDLKLLKDCLLKEATLAVSKLQARSNDKKAYIILLENIYCRLLLLNRRRPGELQRPLLHTYTAAINNDKCQGYEEFSEAISETEKCLMKSFKRIVIKGKRNRGVPVLISKDVSKHLDIVLECRKEVEDNTTNTEREKRTEINRTPASTIKRKSRKKRVLVPWTEKQKNVVDASFKEHIKQRQPPKRNECEGLIAEHPELLENKNWLKIKVFVQNQYRKK
nr:unnamed protein product [Callosobruchus analis]